MRKKTLRVLLISITALSLVSWGFRMTQEYWRPKELPVYALFWLGSLGLFAGALWLATRERVWLRVIGVILGIPFLLLWAFSVLVGFFGLQIH